ncbi:SRPBCC domain-containing protein [Ferruginibacter yonginensis]|uniref:SRPBCC domain-containing protein n=1 Tax=Ferruginibacter yonginensis TaxID=1310416 RepID=A0ABV8QSD9_9BACT
MIENITVTTTVLKPIDKVWEYFTQPQHVTMWNAASDDWHCPAATNDLKVGGTFHYTMAAKDGSMSFDFWGTYNDVQKEKLLEITLGDNRKMTVHFTALEKGTLLKESFEPETQNSKELQQAGWQAILDNFKKYAEGL